MGVDPYADTLRAAVQAAETVASGGAAQSFIEFVLARRPVWQAQAATAAFVRQAASTAPIWRWVRLTGPQFVEAARGTSMAATTSGAGGLASTLGIPIVVAVGSWVMLGAGYYQARQEVRQRGFMSGFSQGFTMGVLNWTWNQAVYRFAMPFPVRRNAFDSLADREEALGYNEGLTKGWAAGNGVPETFYDQKSKQTIDPKKQYRIALRRLAGRTDSGSWSTNENEKRLQQRNYVIELAAAGVKNGLIVME
jgi:hypothetical protein